MTTVTTPIPITRPAVVQESKVYKFSDGGVRKVETMTNGQTVIINVFPGDFPKAPKAPPEIDKSAGRAPAQKTNPRKPSR